MGNISEDPKRHSRRLRFKRPPLVEAIWELRFEPQTMPATDVLLGLLFGWQDKKTPTVVELPAAQIPSQIAANMPDLAYSPRKRLEWQPDFFAQIGDRILSLHILADNYTNWEAFFGNIVNLSDILKPRNILRRIHRTSLRYFNVVALENEKSSLRFLNASINLASKELVNDKISLRWETEDASIMRIIQIATHTQANVGQHKGMDGVLIDIDCIFLFPDLLPGDDAGTWEKTTRVLHKLHYDVEEALIGLLHEDTRRKLGMHWEA